MKEVIVVLPLLAGALLIIPLSSAVEKSGEALFKQHCAPCHIDGGNIVNPKKTLHKIDREANNIKTAQDIIRTMRNPGPGMTKFDEQTIPSGEAKILAEYILKTFK